MSDPLVSIVIPSFNQGPYIRETITSCLDQNFPNLEVIVVDGASTDETLDVLQSFNGVSGFRYVSEPDSGVVEAVTKGVAMVRGTFCGIQSSDDTYMPGAISDAVSVLSAHPEICIAYGDVIKMDAAGAELSRYTSGPFSVENFLSKQTLILQPATFFRRDSFVQAGGWSPAYFNADTECWLRMILKQPALKVDAFWGKRRMHGEQRDHQGAKILESYTRMMQTNAGLQKGPSSWRRAARSGVLLHRIRYAPPKSLWQLRKQYLKAVMAWPPILGNPEIAGVLIPFYYAFRRRCAPRRRIEGSA